jgi:hypothetical protein
MEGPIDLTEDLIQDYDGNELKIGDKVEIIDVDVIEQPSHNDPIVLGDIFIVAGGNDDNIVHVVRDTDGETYGLFGERFRKIFE